MDWFDPGGALADIFCALDACTSNHSDLKVIAGDVLYKSSLIYPFLEVVLRLLGTYPGSRMLLCHIPRAGVEHEHVVVAAERCGLVISPISDSLWKKGSVLKYSPNEDYDRAQLYEIILAHSHEKNDREDQDRKYPTFTTSSTHAKLTTTTDSFGVMGNHVPMSILSSELSSDTLATLMAHLDAISGNQVLDDTEWESEVMMNVEEDTHEIQKDSCMAISLDKQGVKQWTDAKNHEYKEQWYWDKRFEEEDHYEWLLSFDQIKNHLLPHLRRSDNILVIGCGNSQFSYELYDLGYLNIVNIDFSGNVIKKMRSSSLSTARPLMQWIEMDMLDMSFEIGHFDVVIDKATMDALMVDEGDVWHPKHECKVQAHQLCSGVSRILKENGVFLQISFAQPHFRTKYLIGSYTNKSGEISTDSVEEGTSVYGSVQGWCNVYKWNLQYNSIVVDSGSLESLLYICKKGVPP